MKKSTIIYKMLSYFRKKINQNLLNLYVQNVKIYYSVLCNMQYKSNFHYIINLFTVKMWSGNLSAVNAQTLR